MMNQLIEELARLYGIKVKTVDSGNGGLFHVDSNGEKIEMEDIFETSDYITPKHEIVLFRECSSFSTYTDKEYLMIEAA